MGESERLVTGDDAEAAAGASLRESGVEQSLDLLEERVRRASEMIAALRKERAELEGTIAERDKAIQALEGSAKGDVALEKKMTAVVRERDALLHDRAATAARVEAILGRLETLGVE